MSTTSTILTAFAALITLLAIAAATVYFAGYADDVGEWWAKRYYKGKAIAEVKVLEGVGEGKVEGVLKGECLFLRFLFLLRLLYSRRRQGSSELP